MAVTDNMNDFWPKPRLREEELPSWLGIPKCMFRYELNAHSAEYLFYQDNEMLEEQVSSNKPRF